MKKDCSICLEEKCDECRIYSQTKHLNKSMEGVSELEQFYLLNNLKSTASRVKRYKLGVKLGYL